MSDNMEDFEKRADDRMAARFGQHTRRNNMQDKEQGNVGKAFTIMVYHDTDAHGTHKFLTMNSLYTDSIGGREAFEKILAQQYTTFELFGSTPIVMVSLNPSHAEYPDRAGADELGKRIRDAIKTYYPNSRPLEAWVPERKGYIPPKPLTESDILWRPTSNLKDRSEEHTSEL